MTIFVIYRFEMIQIDEQQTHAIAFAAGVYEFLREPVFEQLAIGQARQAVILCLMIELALTLHLDAGRGEDVAGHGALDDQLSGPHIGDETRPLRHLEPAAAG